MMKKVSKIIVVVALIVTMLTGCGSAGSSFGFSVKSSKDEVKPLVVETAEGLKQLVKDETYLQMLYNNEEVTSIIRGWRDSNVPTDQNMYMATVPADFIDLMAQEEPAFGELSDLSKEYVKNSFLASIPSQMVMAYGSTMVAASAAARYSKSATVQKPIENQIWLLTGDDGTCILVTVANTGDNVISASAFFVPCDGIDEFSRELGERFPVEFRFHTMN